MTIETTVTGKDADALDRELAFTGVGAALTADQAYRLARDGNIFVANGATASSPMDFAGAFDADGPDFVIDVPLNKTIVLLSTAVYFEAVGTTLLLETFASVSTTLGAVSTGTAVTPRNLRTGNAVASACTVNCAVDAAGCTAQTGRIYEIPGTRHGWELAEAMAATEDWQERAWTWSAKESGVYPILDGESSLFIHASSQAGTGFITVVYAEFDTAALP